MMSNDHKLGKDLVVGDIFRQHGTTWIEIIEIGSSPDRHCDTIMAHGWTSGGHRTTVTVFPNTPCELADSLPKHRGQARLCDAWDRPSCEGKWDRCGAPAVAVIAIHRPTWLASMVPPVLAGHEVTGRAVPEGRCGAHLDRDSTFFVPISQVRLK